MSATTVIEVAEGAGAIVARKAACVAMPAARRGGDLPVGAGGAAAKVRGGEGAALALAVSVDSAGTALAGVRTGWSGSRPIRESRPLDWSVGSAVAGAGVGRAGAAAVSIDGGEAGASGGWSAAPVICAAGGKAHPSLAFCSAGTGACAPCNIASISENEPAGPTAPIPLRSLNTAAAPKGMAVEGFRRVVGATGDMERAKIRD